jgi:glutathione synthase
LALNRHRPTTECALCTRSRHPIVKLAPADPSTGRYRTLCTPPVHFERGLPFVGIDVIDGNLTEINVTSPTGIRAIARLGGPDVAAMIWDAIEAKRAGE